MLIRLQLSCLYRCNNTFLSSKASLAISRKFENLTSAISIVQNTIEENWEIFLNLSQSQIFFIKGMEFSFKKIKLRFEKYRGTN